MSGSLLNTHWFGSIDKLPPNCKYIGRPGPYGNAHSSKDGTYSKEDCVALHRVDLYHQLITDKPYFSTIKQELDGRDLACWCAIKNKFVACHGMNFLHIFSQRFRERLYDKTVYDYLIEDLTVAMDALKALQSNPITDPDFLDLYMGYGEVKIDISETFRLFKERDTDPYLRCVWLATFVIDLELAALETDSSMRLYRFDRVIWNAFRFSCRPTGREGEPSHPKLKVRNPKIKKD